MEEQVLHLLKDLSDFNKLDNITVTLISKNFNINAEVLCHNNGITYFIKEQ